MSGPTGIAWTDTTWNPVRGCSRVSEGCRNCYAEKIAARFSGPGKPFEGFAESPAFSYGTPAASHRPARPTWTGRVELVPEKLDEPLHWRKPRRVFVNSMSDLFHEDLEPAGALQKVWDVMRRCPQHTFQILTKRAAGMKEAFDTVLSDDPLPNVWLGVSVEDQKTADERIPILLQAPATVRFVSYEPALGPVDLSGFMSASGFVHEDEARTVKPFDLAFVNGEPGHDPWLPSLSWVIVGGESGPKARPFDLAWARSTVTQCRRAGVPVFVKQLGARRVDSTVFPNSEEPGTFAAALVDGYNEGVVAKQLERIRDRAGADPSEWPEALRARELPALAARGGA